MIDCDVHISVPGIESLEPYLDSHWREWVGRAGFHGPDDATYPAGAPTTRRPGAGDGTTLEQVQTDVLDGDGAQLAILMCLYATESVHNPYLGAALSSAVNDWQIEQWLDREPRLRGSIVVPAGYPALAAAEVDRVAAHPGFVQVLLPVRSAQPYGTLSHSPVFEAAARNELTVALHFGGCPPTPPTASGWPSYFIENYAGMASVFQSQLLSLITEGTFERFPATKITLAESGFAWLPAFLWRLDKEWKGLRREVPWVRRRPSEYVRDCVRLTVQPLDCPSELVPRVVERLGSDELLLYASDYPHHHGDSSASIIDAIPTALREGVLAANARAFYRL
jgi:predicted TIM-barrel fold metal-dependent hydrolase